MTKNLLGETGGAHEQVYIIGIIIFIKLANVYLLADVMPT